ncbi:unnamed protein product [Arabidopsis thaliana]|uniref:(thale cress) hypothetical protein n=1 Tax=Arabidopsis thaliana TaxID=3702 RepID=A0A7G2EWF2_ARATH|nr:unnamed protein product [Arabidopsis thaliana]
MNGELVKGGSGVSVKRRRQGDHSEELRMIPRRGQIKSRIAATALHSIISVLSRSR